MLHLRNDSLVMKQRVRGGGGGGDEREREGEMERDNMCVLGHAV